MSEENTKSEDKDLKQNVQKILSGETYFPVPMIEITDYDYRSFEAGYHMYERLLKEYLQTILGL